MLVVFFWHDCFEGDMPIHDDSQFANDYWNHDLINNAICSPEAYEKADPNDLKDLINSRNQSFIDNDDQCLRMEVRYTWGKHAEYVINAMNEIAKDFRAAGISGKKSDYKKLERYLEYPVNFVFYRPDLGMEKAEVEGEYGGMAGLLYGEDATNFDEFVKYSRMMRDIDIKSRKDRGFGKIEGMRMQKRFNDTTISISTYSYRIYIYIKKDDLYKCFAEQQQNSCLEGNFRIFRIRTTEMDKF